MPINLSSFLSLIIAGLNVEGALKMKALWVGILLFCCQVSTYAQPLAIKQYQLGVKAIKNNNTDEYNYYVDLLKGNAFESLLKYQFLSQNFSAESIEEAKNFIKQHPSTLMSVRLKRQLLQHYFDTQQYEAYVDNYTDVLQKKYNCQYFYAKYKQGQIKDVNDQLKTFYVSGKKLSPLCEATFKLYVQSSPEPDVIIWPRFTLALTSYQLSFAKDLSLLLTSDKQKLASAILQTYKSPYAIRNKSFVAKHDSPELISYGLYRLARRQPATAAKLLTYYKTKYTFTAEQLKRVNQAIALRYALRKNKLATRYYRKVIGQPLAPVYESYLFKAALYHKDWQLLKDSIAAMKADKKNQPRFKYWYGKALIKLGHRSEGQQVLKEVAQIRDYYGFLASYHLKQAPQVNDSGKAYIKAEQERIQNLPGLIRAKAFYQNDQKHHARVELFYLMQFENEKNKYLITKEVEHWGWLSQSVRMSFKLNHKDDLGLRYPMKYQQVIAKHAAKHKVPQPLIYAIIRQESLFTVKIRSHAGAIGLMQLMPKTAHITSKQYKIPYKGADSLKHAKTNLKLGIAHLHRLNLELNKHPLLIIASYNAGKRAVRRWIPNNRQGLDGEIWIEMVPYKETRRYLRHVVANYVIYQHRLGLKPSLKTVLRAVK